MAMHFECYEDVWLTPSRIRIIKGLLKSLFLEFGKAPIVTKFIVDLVGRSPRVRPVADHHQASF